MRIHTFSRIRQGTFTACCQALNIAGSCQVFTWLPFCRQLSIIDGPNADNTAPAPEHVKKKAKSAEESHQPATLSGSGKLETTVRNEVQKQLAIHREQEEKRTTFLAKAPLLRLASDILSFTLAAVLPPPTANNSIDIWSSPLAQDNQLAGHVKKMCQRNKCPVSEQRLAIEFNQIRRDKHGRCLWIFCMLCSHTAIN